jgi:hypothetical protein
MVLPTVALQFLMNYNNITKPNLTPKVIHIFWHYHLSAVWSPTNGGRRWKLVPLVAMGGHKQMYVAWWMVEIGRTGGNKQYAWG